MTSARERERGIDRIEIHLCKICIWFQLVGSEVKLKAAAGSPRHKVVQRKACT